MRNNRGEWDYREPYDKDNFEFVRNSKIKSWEIEAKRSYFWDEAKWLMIAVFSTVAFSCAIGFALGYLVGE